MILELAEKNIDIKTIVFLVNAEVSCALSEHVGKPLLRGQSFNAGTVSRYALDPQVLMLHRCRQGKHVVDRSDRCDGVEANMTADARSTSSIDAVGVFARSPMP